MNSKTKYILLGIVGLLLIYLIYKKQSATFASVAEDVDEGDLAAKNSAKSAARAAEDAVSNVEMTIEEEEYNQAREDYRKLSGKYPPSSWSKSMIDSWIREQEKKNEALKKYIGIVSSSNGYAKDEHTDDMTLSQIESLITKAQNDTEEGRRKAAEAAAAKQKAERTAYIKELVKRFQATLQSPNYMLMSATKKNAWDTSTLSEMLTLSAAEKKEFNSLFASMGGSGKIPDYFNQKKSKWQNRLSVYEAIRPGNANTGRTGASMATSVKKAYSNL